MQCRLLEQAYRLTSGDVCRKEDPVSSWDCSLARDPQVSEIHTAVNSEASLRKTGMLMDGLGYIAFK